MFVVRRALLVVCFVLFGVCRSSLFVVLVFVVCCVLLVVVAVSWLLCAVSR